MKYERILPVTKNTRKMFKKISLSVVMIVIMVFSSFGQDAHSSLKGKNNTDDTSGAIKSIQQYLALNYKDLNLLPGDIKYWEVTDDYFSRKGQIRHVYLRQSLDGVPLLNGVANVTMNKQDSVVYISSSFVYNLQDRFNPNIVNSVDSKQAVDLAAQHLKLEGNAGNLIESDAGDSYKFEKGTLSLETIDVSYGMWNNGEVIRPTWVVSIQPLSGDHWWQLFVDAETGEELHRIDWVKTCTFGSKNTNHNHTKAASPLPMMPPPPPGTDQYNVFAFPVESPDHGASSLEVGPYSPNASPFGWHDENGVAGAEYTITRGNNVFAYEDAGDNNAPGFSPDGGPNLDFNIPIDLNQAPANYQASAITNLFYANNRIHDILYEYGFDEASGNFQITNYSGSGQGQDHVLAEAQDGGGTNNANFATPPDGTKPRMQMYIWTNGSNVSDLLTVNSPAIISGTYNAAEATFGPGVSSTPITADLELIDDGTGATDDGCEPAINGATLNGKIVVIYRGTCNFVTKVANAQAEGAVAVIMINNAAGAPIAMGGTDPSITIPSIMISQADGNALVSQIVNSTVNATIVNGSGNFQKDGDYDNGIITHEYGHGVSNRLTGGPSQSGCLGNAEQMGEGWSDFLGLMLTTDMSVANPVYRPVGTYATSEAPTGIGIRNAPYDTSFAVNNYTYGDVADAANVSQPHGIGFVWCTMLWDLNWAFINQYGFDANIETGTGGNNMALQLVMEGMKLQPCNPGFVDGRDAILLADQLLYGGANECLIWKVFAKRGLGFSAQQGSSGSRSDQTEAFDIPQSCQIPTLPPVANFTANTLITCSGEVQFQDLSTEIPQSWSWNFGDGNTSTQQNPFHTYSDAGVYTVTLEVTNTEGNDVLTSTNYIEVTIPDAPIGTDGFGCPTDSIMLTASGTNTIHWTDSSGTLLSTGNVFYAPASNNPTSYYATNVEEFPVEYIGPADNSFGTGGYHNSAFVGALNFTADKKFVIYSVWVDSEFPGVRQISLSNGYNTTGTAGSIIETVSVNIPFTGPGRIELGITVPGPGQYSLGLDNAGLYRNDSGANYPYVAPGFMSIVSSSATSTASDFYYYFYDLEIGEPSCASDTIAVTTNLLSNTGLDEIAACDTYTWIDGETYTSSNNTATHTLTNAAGCDSLVSLDLTMNYNSTSVITESGVNIYTAPSGATYTTSGTYTDIILNAAGCDSIITIHLTMSSTGLDEHQLGSVNLSPNPSSEEITISVSEDLVGSSFVVLDQTGRVTYEGEINELETKLQISNLAYGLYYLKVGEIKSIKFVKQ